MVTFVALHWRTQEDVERGMEVFEANSEKFKKAKGFVSRQVLRSRSDPYKITTVTTFETMEDYESFFKIDPNRLNKQRSPEDPAELDIYDLVSSV